MANDEPRSSRSLGLELTPEEDRRRAEIRAESMKVRRERTRRKYVPVEVRREATYAERIEAGRAKRGEYRRVVIDAVLAVEATGRISNAQNVARHLGGEHESPEGLKRLSNTLYQLRYTGKLAPIDRNHRCHAPEATRPCEPFANAAVEESIKAECNAVRAIATVLLGLPSDSARVRVASQVSDLAKRGLLTCGHS